MSVRDYTFFFFLVLLRIGVFWFEVGSERFGWIGGATYFFFCMISCSLSCLCLLTSLYTPLFDFTLYLHTYWRIENFEGCLVASGFF